MYKTLEAIYYDFQPGDYFIDIGGNVGLWTIELLSLYNNIFLIEPSKIALEQAKFNINTHCDFFNAPELKKKVRYYKNLVSDVAGQFNKIATTSDDTGNFSIYAEELYGIENVVLSEDAIETITVDSLISEIPDGSKVLIKIDTEGCDLDVLLGSFEFIKKFKPIIMVEFHWHMYYNQEKKDKVFSLLRSLAYKAQDYVFTCYCDDPERLFDGIHTGEQLKTLHFQVSFTPPN